MNDQIESKNNISNSIFWIETDKIVPNPYQPRKEFDEKALRELADSIKQYGILQPLVATRREIEKEDGGLAVEYELISGERRLRASRLAGLSQVPVVIRTGEQSDTLKFELAIIENLQREDLNVIDRAKAFQALADKFNYKHAEIAVKVGKSREYVSNSIRVLALSPEIQDALINKKITEGHCRPLLMLGNKPEEQITLFKEIIYKKLTVREAESISRHIATDKVRKKEYMMDPDILDMESKLTEKLGTRVHIEKKDFGGKVTIDFFSKDDLRSLLDMVSKGKIVIPKNTTVAITETSAVSEAGTPVDDSTPDEVDDSELYSIKNFSL
ncbi:MAG TPA: ParB/RepB/Spo0J family partition protein [Candidatus Paceibacterota bacterium]|nr:ParB/RepB/Spo0J family partition protein [Candidatus Paceibacterota bacterium]